MASVEKKMKQGSKEFQKTDSWYPGSVILALTLLRLGLQLNDSVSPVYLQVLVP